MAKHRDDPTPKLGRPARFHKPLPRTFMMSEEADAILDEAAQERACSRSDVLDEAVRKFARGRRTRGR